jgi:hypothetical protein
MIDDVQDVKPGTEDSATRATKNTPDDALSPEQKYQRDYYRTHKESRSDAHKRRWRTDPDYRQREIERARRKRAIARARDAANRFEQMVEEKRKAAKPTRRPRLAQIDGEDVFVYTTGSVAREVGREDATIRAWLAQEVLPGPSLWIGVRAHFTEDYAKALRAACKRLLCLDGRGDLDVLKRLVREELIRRQVSFVPAPGEARVYPWKEPVTS